MDDGEPVPARHDGMALVPGASDDELVLLRNHENLFDRFVGNPKDVPTYDSSVNQVERDGETVPVLCGGGVSGVVLKNGEYSHTVPLLGGTAFNCAGGPTPWGSWLTCEEMILTSQQLPDLKTPMQPHGYVFEVPAPHQGKASAVPIKDMGRFRHEAVAVDPATNAVYLTEDNGPTSGLYRFDPTDASGGVGSYESGGKLSMLKVAGTDNVNLTPSERGTSVSIEWVEIEDPDKEPSGLAEVTDPAEYFRPVKSGPYEQGEVQGGAQFGRLEGSWYYDGRIYFIDTSGGAAGAGSVWVLDISEQTLAVLYASPKELEADAIDNITVNHVNGTVVVCEDGGGVNVDDELVHGCRMLIVKPDGTVVSLAENNINLESSPKELPFVAAGDYRPSEWAGATFSPDGEILYANIQTPGVTFAISGPIHLL